MDIKCDIADYAHTFKYSSVYNLLDNAVKYSSENKSVLVKLYQQGTGVNIDVIDQGVGISPEHLSKLFGRFYRVDKARSRQFGGTGLGLAIVKHIIEAHQQTINVRSTEGIGTTFAFTLPMAKKKYS
jgi:two-component system phosphate regulon sensor histidine kinase PhoR